MANEFEAFHGISRIIGAIDGLHIPILVPMIGGGGLLLSQVLSSSFVAKVLFTQNVCFGISSFD